MNHLRIYAVWALLLGVAACDSGNDSQPATTAEPEVAAPGQGPDTVVVSHNADTAKVGFPTVELVGYVLNCMSEHGGQSVENLYSCSCRVDHISARMDFDTYDSANTYRRYRRMPGEKGGIFRENQDADHLIGLLEEHEAEAAKTCPVVRRSPDSKKTERQQ